MDRDDLARPECEAVVREVYGVIEALRTKGLRYSSWFGRLEEPNDRFERLNRGASYAPWPGNPDDAKVPWFLLWETAWLLSRCPAGAGDAVLDMGGASSVFSCVLAARGARVLAIDLQEDLCANANEVGRAMGWDLRARAMDMRRLEVPDGSLDRIYSVCVFEHLPRYDRVEINRGIRAKLRPGGTFAITFDYANPVNMARIDTPADVRRQFVTPSGLEVVGNGEFLDNGRRYLEYPGYYRRRDGVLAGLGGRLSRAARGEIRWGRAFSSEDRHYTFGALVQRRPA